MRLMLKSELVFIQQKELEEKADGCMKNEKSGELVFTMGQHPQPYLQPALDNNKEKIQQCFEGII